MPKSRSGSTSGADAADDASSEKAPSPSKEASAEASEISEANSIAAASSTPSTPSGSGGHERRRSERVKKVEKPDYYGDALDFDKRIERDVLVRPRGSDKGTPARSKRSERTPGKSPKGGRQQNSTADAYAEGVQKGRALGSASSSGRATLTWKKGKAFQ